MANRSTLAARSAARAPRAYGTERQAWLDIALDTLRRDGIDGVRIEVLAQKLGISKGSFYWQFRNRQELLDEMLLTWEQRMTTDVVEAFRPSADFGSARERLFATLETVFLSKLNRYDAAVRAWGRVDERVFRRVQAVDRRRIAFLHQALEESGIDTGDALPRAELLYGYIVGSPSVFPRRGPDSMSVDLWQKLGVLFE